MQTEWRSGGAPVIGAVRGGGVAAGLGLTDEPTWRSALAFREERTRRRRRMRAILLIGSMFSFGILQVWLSTQAAEYGSRVSQLTREASRLEEELMVARAQLAGRQLYGDLLGPAERGGFEPGAQRRVLWVPESAPVAELSLWRQMTHELERGSKLILDEALAQDRRPEASARAGRR
jgi:hypothetical protein